MSKLKLTKKKAEEFSRALCGTAKGLEKREIGDIWQISNGHMRYDFWILNGRIYVQIMVINHCITSYFFDYETLEPDFIYTDEDRDKSRHEDFCEQRLETMDWLESKGINIPENLRSKYKSR